MANKNARYENRKKRGRQGQTAKRIPRLDQDLAVVLAIKPEQKDKSNSGAGCS